MEALDTLERSRRSTLRERYIKSLLREVEATPETKVLLDKNPSPTASLHIWLRVFPELKVIIALRDPRDVIISCFFLNIMLNATNVNFLSLERTAKHYANLMDVWLRLRELGGFSGLKRATRMWWPIWKGRGGASRSSWVWRGTRTRGDITSGRDARFCLRPLTTM